MIKTNFLKEKLNSGKNVIGTWSIIPSVINTEILATSGLDFIIIDGEHGPINFETAQKMAIACELHKVSPLMRVSGVKEDEILKALDIGCHGVQIPNVNSIDQVKLIVKYSKYPPNGNRGLSIFTRAGMYSINNAQKLPKVANENTLIGINIEDTDSIKNIDEILEIKELDLVFIGLYDLSKSLGIPGQINDPKVTHLLIDLVKKINNKGKFAGTIAVDKNKIQYFFEIGIKYLLYSVDCEVIRSSYNEVVKIKNNLLI